MTRAIINGITYKDIMDAAVKGHDFETGARYLGVSENHLRLRCKRLGMNHWLAKEQHQEYKISEAQLTRIASMGLTRDEAATTLQVGYCTVRRAIRRYDINHLFPPRGKAQFVKGDR